MLLEFSISPSAKGDVYATNFVFTKTNLPTYTQTTWDLGDGNFVYNTEQVTHSYNFPGIYKVSLSAWSSTGNLETTFKNVDVDYVIRDAIIIDQIPTKWGLPGLPSSEPFVVSLTSAKINQPLAVVLQALNTKSIPHYAVPEKWSFIVPTWKFVNADTNEILNGSILLSTTPIYKDSTIIGVKGQARFYYIDDSSTGTDPTQSCPLLITATLSTENFHYPPETLHYPYYGYSNSEVARAVVAWQISDIIPTDLKVTENFISEIYPIKWANVPIPIMITCKFDPNTIDTYASSVITSATNVLSYPRTNELGLLSSVDVKVLGLSSNQYTVDEVPLFFKATDEYNNLSTGYIFTTVTPLVTCSTASVFVSTVAHNQIEKENEFPFPDGFPVTPEVYISHPFEGNINKVNVITYSSNCENVDYFKSLGALTDGSISFIPVPRLSSASVANLELSGTSGILGVTYNPVKELIYAADADQDKIYAINANSQIIHTLNLSSVFGEVPLSPCYISVDGNYNVWISLYDRYTILKYDYTLQTLLASAVPTIVGDLSALEVGTPLIAPPVAETDKNDHIWVCYTNPLSSFVLKFDQYGNYLTEAQDFSIDSAPVSLAINKRNDVWVACREANEVQCFDTNGVLLSSFEFYKPTHVAVDRQNNLWVLHGYNFFSVLNTTTAQASSWKLQTKPKPAATLVFNQYTPISGYSSEDLDVSLNTNEIWGGLTVDVYNRVWVIDNENNTSGVFSVLTPENIRVFDIKPTATKNYILKASVDNFVTEISTSAVRSAQAFGDWSGNRWYQKYAGRYNVLPISGVSVPFEIRELDAEGNIAKVNDDFNCSEYMYSLALPENLSQKTKFFKEFLPELVGNGQVDTEDLGRIVYEKIANYVSNHSDVDTAEIDQLNSLCEQMSVPYKTFGINFPEEIKRLINIFSVPKNSLRGVPKLDPDINNNIGEFLTETSYISSGQYLFAKDKQFDVFRLVYVAPVDGLGNIYQLSALQVEGLREPILDNYYFFQYNDQNSTGYQSNLIDWNSPYTTISYNLSTNEQWYGDDQMIELYFNKLLTKRLFDI